LYSFISFNFAQHLYLITSLGINYVLKISRY